MEHIIYTLLEASITMAIIIVLVLLFHHFFGKKYAAKWRYYIWFVVLLGLLLPFRPEFETALIKAPIVTNVATNTNEPQATSGGATNISEVNAVETTAATWSWSLPLILFSIWLTGFIIFLAYNIWKHYRFLNMVKRWTKPVTDRRILSLFEQERHALGIKSKHIDIHMCRFEISPMLIGFRKPTILLPEKPIDDEELSLILRHELVHYRRKDLWVNTALLLATAIHWFNPFVYVMGRAFQNDCEESCDEQLLMGANLEKRRTYGEAIIGLIKNKDVKRTALSTNFYGGKRTLKNRLTSIMDTSKKKVGVAVLCCGATAVAVILSGSIFMNQGSEKAEAAAEITAKRAQEIALAETGGGTVVKYSLDYDNGKKMYDIKIVKGNVEYEMDISATNSKIYSFEKKTIPTTVKATTTAAASKLKVTPVKEITVARAKQIALAKTGGGTVTRATVDYENGRKVFDIQIVNGSAKYEMDVGATDSKIYSYEKETVRTNSAKANNSTQNNTTNSAQTTKPKTNTTAPKTSTATEITVARAQQIALAKTGGGRVVQSSVDYENGRKVYDIKIINGNLEYDMEIGAANSVVYSFEKEVINKQPATSTKPNTNSTSNNATYNDYDDDDRYDDDRYDNDYDDDKYDNDYDDDDRYDND
ncbi:hypothetical protein HCA69_06210 [Listeria grandensis]|uniref:Peptidase M56 n=1 Tax=Listeria grandensis TaxID=1494963 RepID=A0A7X0Y303_9LIST|nr:M56 family metallopeptidase [Listeria grandensis]MBC1935954.1 hypothetical protein [Listeria grandensis]